MRDSFLPCARVPDSLRAGHELVFAHAGQVFGFATVSSTEAPTVTVDASVELKQPWLPLVHVPGRTVASRHWLRLSEPLALWFYVALRCLPHVLMEEAPDATGSVQQAVCYH